MPNIKVGFRGKVIFYDIDGGGYGEEYIHPLMTDAQLTYSAIVLGLNEFFIKWQKELDARAFDVGEEGIGTQKVADPAVFTERPMPPPINVILSDTSVYEELAGLRKCHPLNKKLHNTVKQMTHNIEVKFRRSSRK